MGRAWCQAHSDLTDAWLRELVKRVTGDGTDGLALVAVGGYGRAELCPHSDIDVVLLHHRRPDVAEVANGLWYPIWDRGVKLGHGVATVREELRLAANDLDTATALLSARHVAGDETLTAQLVERAREQWVRGSHRWLADLAAGVQGRHEMAGEVAFLLEPDLKEGRGGLRDVHALAWAEAAREILLDHDHPVLAGAYAVLLDARVELHRLTDRPTNVLALQEQDAVAAALGLDGADALMARVAEAGRTIAWTSDDAWRRILSGLRGPPSRIARRTRELTPGVLLQDGEVELHDSVALADDPALVLRVASLAASHGTAIERHSLERLAAGAPALPDPWPAGARPLLCELLLAGAAAVGVIEALDQRGVWVRVLPEWASVRSRPQHNPYHRFTVDRHLLETAANASELARDGRVERPDLLVVAALLHDLGKDGGQGDHTENGVALAQRVGTRLGFSPDDVSTLVALIQFHLLLPDVATRRDLDDPATVQHVAAAIGSVERLHLLAALTEADARATGPSAWGPSRAALVGELVDRVARVLGGLDVMGGVPESFPTERHLARLAAPGQQVDGHDDVLTVVTDDRPGVFSRVAGVVALHGLDVIKAMAYSNDGGRALAEFHVLDPRRHQIAWDRVIGDVELALNGRLAVNARLAERARLYTRNRPPTARSVASTVGFDNRASATATVIDVTAPDRIGALFRITRALAELDLDIRSARVQTLGTQVVDSFYVRDRNGGKVTEQQRLDEIERAILHSVAEARATGPT
jgi:[protein-PII] uridylyltransferase